MKDNQSNGVEAKWKDRSLQLKSLNQSMQELSAQIKESSGKGKCTDDSHCKVTGLGAKACGKYSNFLVYSTMDTSEGNIIQLVGQFNRAAEQFNIISMEVQRCGEAPLNARCSKSRCTVR